MKRKKASFSFVLFLRDSSLRLALFFSAADNVDVSRQPSRPHDFSTALLEAHTVTPHHLITIFSVYFILFYSL